jgi:hypothetical protein
LILVACGCAGSAGTRPGPSASAALATVQKTGVCAAVRGIDGDAWSSDPKVKPAKGLGNFLLSASAEACARTRPGEKEAGALDVTLVFPVEDERWRTENWHLEVVRKDGLVVEAGTLPAGREVFGGCAVGTCLQEDHATLPISEPWRVDSYKIRLRHVPTRTRVDLKIQLD